VSELLPVDAILALGGRCWRCQHDFSGELYYVLVSTWATCVGCAIAVGVFDEERPMTPDSGVAGSY
jgi:hypothetical protein